MPANRWTVDAAQSEVVVRAQSTLHDTSSRARGVTGTLHGDLDALETTAGGEVVVDLRKMSFGDRVRDFAMSRHLDLKRWPEARFRVDGAEVHSRDPWRITVRGTLRYRDRETAVAVEATGEVTEAGLDARAPLPLSLSGLGVPPPRFLFLKVADAVNAEVHLVATRRE